MSKIITMNNKIINVLGSGVTSDGFKFQNVTRRFFEQEMNRINKTGKKTYYKEDVTFMSRRPSKQWNFTLPNGDRYRFFLIGEGDNEVKDYTIEKKKTGVRHEDRPRWVVKNVKTYLDQCV